MSADVKTSAELAEDLDLLLKRNGHLLSFADVCIVTRAILALREADQRGAQQVSTDPLNATADPQSAPPHPGGQPVAWTTVLSLELAKGAFYASPVNLWAEKGIPIYTHPGGQEKAAPVSPVPTVVEKLRDALRMVLDDYTTAGVRLSQDHYIHVALAAAEEERSRG